MRIGPFDAEFVRVTHSIPDAVAVALHTAEGTILHTGDFKLDHTPIDGVRTDLARLAALGERGVALMLGDSTNAENPGTTASEAIVADALRRIVREAPGRVIVTSFASHIHRLQEVIDAAAAAGRRVCVVGRSMVKNLNIARNLGYADVPEGAADQAPGARRAAGRRRRHPVHGVAGRAAVGPHAHRLRRPPVGHASWPATP